MMVTQSVIARFDILPTSGEVWLIAADWLEDQGLTVEAAAFRVGVYKCESRAIDNYAEDSGDGDGSGYGDNDGYCYGSGSGSGFGDGFGFDLCDGSGDGDGSGSGYGFGDGGGSGYTYGNN